MPIVLGLVLIITCVTVICPPHACAIEGASDLTVENLSRKPIEITAKELIAETQNRRVVFQGDVVATQNSLIIYSDSLIAEYDEDGKTIARIEAIGNVKVVQERIREARGDRAIFINADQTVELSGNTVVSEGDSRLIGERLILYIAENRSVIHGGENGRVKAIINPEAFVKEQRNKEVKQDRETEEKQGK